MKKSEFIKELCEELEVENPEEVTEDTLLAELPEYDSMANLALIAMVDKHFGKKLSVGDLQGITTVKSLIEIIGENQFE